MEIVLDKCVIMDRYDHYPKDSKSSVFDEGGVQVVWTVRLKLSPNQGDNYNVLVFV